MGGRTGRLCNKYLPQKAVVNDRWVFWVCCGYDFASGGNRRCQNRKRKQSSHLASDQRESERGREKKGKSQANKII